MARHQHDPLHFGRNLAAALILVLIAFLAYALWPFVTALFGAIILFVLFRPTYLRLRTRMKDGIAASLVIILSVFIVLAPLFFLVTTAAGQVSGAVAAIGPSVQWLRGLDTVAGVDVNEFTADILASAGAFVKSLVLSILGSVTGIVLNIFIMYVLLYFLLVNAGTLRHALKPLLPFNAKNTQQLVDELDHITHATVVVSGIIAVVQGALLGISFAIFGLPAPLFWGFVAGILSILPVIGTGFVWAPAVAILLVSQQYGTAIGLLIAGAIIGTVDNLLRPLLSKKVANVHPLITLLGVVAGVPFFGVIGVLIGPLLISYLLLMMRMFREEYLA